MIVRVVPSLNANNFLSVSDLKKNVHLLIAFGWLVNKIALSVLQTITLQIKQNTLLVDGEYMTQSLLTVFPLAYFLIKYCLHKYLNSSPNCLPFKLNSEFKFYDGIFSA